MEDETKPLNIVEEAKFIRDQMLQAKEEMKAEREALQKAQSESLLSSTAGSAVPVVPEKVETPKEYAERVMRNEVKQND